MDLGRRGPEFDFDGGRRFGMVCFWGSSRPRGCGFCALGHLFVAQVRVRLGLIIIVVSFVFLLLVPFIYDSLESSQVFFKTLLQLPSHIWIFDPVKPQGFGNVFPVPQHVKVVVGPHSTPEIPQIHNSFLDRWPDINIALRVLDEVSEVAVKYLALCPFGLLWRDPLPTLRAAAVGAESNTG